MWDYGSAVFYLFLGIVGYLCINRERKQYYRTAKIDLISIIILFLVWGIVAVFRYVGVKDSIILGGGDAPTYVDYFETCLSPYCKNIYSYRTELLFRLFTKVIRSFTNDYHVYFIIIYGFIMYSYIIFINEFDIKEYNKLPLIMLFFLYLQSFCAVRTHLTIAIMLLILVAVNRKRIVLSVIFAIISVFIQKSSLIYVVFPFFYQYYKKKNFSVKKALFLCTTGCLVGALGKQIILSGDVFGFDSVYANYVSSSSDVGYFVDYIKLILEQVIIDVWMVILLNSKKMKTGYYRRISGNTDNFDKKMDMMKIMCYYDLMLIPVCYIMGIWRGQSYFFLPRLFMLGFIISSGEKIVTSTSRALYRLLCLLLILVWFIVRLITVYDVSNLMPYVFAF